MDGGADALQHRRRPRPDGDARAFAISATLFYLFAYTFMNVGAWGTVMLLRRNGVAGENLEDYGGLVQRSPAAFVAMLVFLLSLGGIPPLAGFLGKWYVFTAAVNSGWTWLAVVGAINAAISIFYYLRIVVVMVVEISLITPPIGLNVFILKSMLPDVPLSTIFRGIIPFFIADIVRLLAVVFFPAIALFLPRLLA